MTVHIFQRFGAAALKRNMKLGTEFFTFSQFFYNLVGNMVGFQRAKAHPENTVCITAYLYSVCNIVIFVFTVGGKVNADKHYLFNPVLSQSFYLCC